MIRKLALLCVAALLATSVFGQSAIIRGESSAGVYENIKTDGSQHLQVQLVGQLASTVLDPCQSAGVTKSSVAINISTATTTQLVAISGTTAIYVCNFSLTISQVITTANTLLFEYGTGSTCGTGTTVLTGLFGAGGVSAAAPIVVTGFGSTLFKAPAGNALCALTAIGATGSFQGVLTYVQQ